MLPEKTLPVLILDKLCHEKGRGELTQEGNLVFSPSPSASGELPPLRRQRLTQADEILKRLLTPSALPRQEAAAMPTQSMQSSKTS